MVQPVSRIASARAARDVALALETPAEVAAFEARADTSADVRAFLQTPEWAALRTRIVGDGRPPTGRASSLDDLARLFRWSADGTFSERPLSSDARGAYLHAAAELDAYGRNASRVSPAPASKEYVTGLGGERVAVPLPDASGRVADTVGATGFGEALLAVQAGRHVARSSWAQGSFVTAQAGYPQGIGVNANTAAATGLAEGTFVSFPPYLMRCTVNEHGRLSCTPWTPGQADLFAQNWRILPRPGA